MVWWPFATKPQRADTSEVTDLYSNAPPLYSTIKLIFLIAENLTLRIAPVRPPG